MYPGAHGPLSSLRLEAYRRGLEDRALLALLGVKERAELTARLVRGPSNWTIDAATMEQTRRDAAALIGTIRQCPGPPAFISARPDSSSSLPLKSDDGGTVQEPELEPGRRSSGPIDGWTARWSGAVGEPFKVPWSRQLCKTQVPYSCNPYGDSLPQL